MYVPFASFLKRRVFGVILWRFLLLVSVILTLFVPFRSYVNHTFKPPSTVTGVLTLLHMWVIMGTWYDIHTYTIYSFASCSSPWFLGRSAGPEPMGQEQYYWVYCVYIFIIFIYMYIQNVYIRHAFSRCPERLTCISIADIFNYFSVMCTRTCKGLT